MTTIPKGATVPADHQKSAAQLEAEGVATVDVEHNGQSFTLPSDPQDWPVGALRAFGRGDPLEAIPLLIGVAEYDRLGLDIWSGRQLNALFEKFAKAAGFDSAGE